MVVPLFGLLLSVPLFGAVGVLALWVLRVAQRQILALLLFIATAQLGMLAFAVFYSAAFANAQNHLESRARVLGLVVGLPVAGSLLACIVLRWAVNTPWWVRSRPTEV